MPGLAGEMTRIVQLADVGHRISAAQAWCAQSERGRNAIAEAVGLGSIEADGRARTGPGAIEQRQYAVMKDIRKASKSRVFGVVDALSDIVGQMERQRPLRTEQTEKIHVQQRRKAIRSRSEIRQRGRSERQRTFCPSRIGSSDGRGAVPRRGRSA